MSESEQTQTLQPEISSAGLELEIKGVHSTLGALPENTIVNMQGLATLLKRETRSIERAVKKGDLPHPTILFGKRSWTIRSIIEHFERRIKAENELQRKLRVHCGANEGNI